MKAEGCCEVPGMGGNARPEDLRQDRRRPDGRGRPGTQAPAVADALAGRMQQEMERPAAALPAPRRMGP